MTKTTTRTARVLLVAAVAWGLLLGGAGAASAVVGPAQDLLGGLGITGVLDTSGLPLLGG